MCKAFQIYDNLPQIDDNLGKFAFIKELQVKKNKLLDQK